MEVMYELALALGCAIGLVALFGLLRQALRSSSMPSWFANTIVAYVSALVLTVGFAGSLFFVGASLQPLVPVAVAFFGTFAIHLGLVALCLRLLPADQTGQSRASNHAVPADALPA